MFIIRCAGVNADLPAMSFRRVVVVGLHGGFVDFVVDVVGWLLVVWVLSSSLVWYGLPKRCVGVVVVVRLGWCVVFVAVVVASASLWRCQCRCVLVGVSFCAAISL